MRTLAVATLLLLGGCAKKAPAPVQTDARAEAVVSHDAAVAPLDAGPPRALLDVRVPAAAPAGTPAAKLKIRLDKEMMGDPYYEGFSVAVGNAPPRVVGVGEKVVLDVVPGADGMFRFQVGGTPVLAALRPGEELSIHGGHDDGWVVEPDIVPENAPKAMTICRRVKRDCPKGYDSANVFEGDPVCPRVEDDPHKCVKAPVVRARGPLAGKATVGEASESGLFDDLDAVPLAPKGLAAGAFGPWIAVALGGERVPLVSLNDHDAFVVMSPGEQWEVWPTPDGRVDAARVP